jgi:hypothetical protein
MALPAKKGGGDILSPFRISTTCWIDGRFPYPTQNVYLTENL